MTCDKEEHVEHICALTAKGEIEKAHTLSLHPTVECGNCGAKAKEVDAVCDPVQLPEAGWLGD